MNINWKFVSGVLVASVLFDQVQYSVMERRLKKLQAQLSAEVKLSADLYRYARHLARKSDEHKLPVETFEIGLLSDFEERMGH